MRLAVGTLVSAVVLFVADAVGALGAWALLAGVGAMLVSAVLAVIVMEERDFGVLDVDPRVLARAGSETSRD